ncbi:hypothetical protein Sste5344_000779 [Sporothrix stenoceras]
MINTPPSERPPSQQNAGPVHGGMSGSGHGNLNSGLNGPPMQHSMSHGGVHQNQNKPFMLDIKHGAPGVPRNPDEFVAGSALPAASAAAALAQLHTHKLDREWDEGRELLPSILSGSPPGRSSTLPPLQRPLGPARPRKQSVTKRSRETHHKKQKSRGSASDWLRRIQNESAADRLRPGGPLKAMSAEPSDFGKRWEDLIDAAASATEDIDDDRTPVPQSPISIHRASLPPFPHQAFQHQQHTQGGYQASPLQQALTPPSYAQEMPEPFPSVESNESGDIFNMESRGLSDSSPSYSSQNPQIYCAACGNISQLRESYACTECICGLCQPCVEVLMGEQGASRKCPRCHTIGGRFKPFQLDIR